MTIINRLVWLFANCGTGAGAFAAWQSAVEIMTPGELQKHRDDERRAGQGLREDYD